MEQSKRNRGARSGWPLASPSKLIAGLVLAGVAAWPAMTSAQEVESCGGSLTNSFIAPTPATPRFVGDTLRVRSTITNTTVDSPWAVNLFDHKLDCANAGNFFACTDEGTVITYVGNVATTCQDATDTDVTWGADTATVNLVSFTPSAPVLLDAVGGLQTSCTIDFDVQIASLSTDGSPFTITSANNAEGLCETLPGSAQGSLSTSVATCGITLKKQVQDPDTLAWLDADNAVNGDGEDLLQVIFKDADPVSLLDTGDVLYRLVVKNTSSVAMSSVLVDDSALGVSDAEVGPLAADEEKTVTSGTIGALNALGRCVASGNLENTSTATGVCRATAPVVDEDASNNAWVQCIGVPHIKILKEVRLNGAGDWFDANAPGGVGDPDPITPAGDWPPVGGFGDDAEYRITVTNDGTVDLKEVVVNDPTLGIVDHPVGDLAVGDPPVVLLQGDIAALFVEDRCNVRGDYLNTASTSGKSVETDEEVTDSDPAALRCAGEPDIDIEKQISIDGKALDDLTKEWFDADTADALDTPTVEAPSGAMYRFIVENIGDVDLTGLEIEDLVLGIGPLDIPGNLVLEKGESVTINSGTAGYAALDVTERCDHGGTFENSVTVDAHAVDVVTDTVTDSDPAFLICTGDDLCLTRTPGFWGTHPHVTDLFLDIEVCGKPIDTTDAGTNSSSAEAMCVSGQDAKKGGSNMHYLQLVRQLTAAKLNVAASATNEGTCDSVGGVDIDLLIERCEAAALCGDTGAKAGKLIAASGCIEQLDAFNNSEDTLDVFGPFVSPGPAAPAECQEANGNGVIVK